jgi:hypothetical protein
LYAMDGNASSVAAIALGAGHRPCMETGKFLPISTRPLPLGPAVGVHAGCGVCGGHPCSRVTPASLAIALFGSLVRRRTVGRPR